MYTSQSFSILASPQNSPTRRPLCLIPMFGTIPCSSCPVPRTHSFLRRPHYVRRLTLLFRMPHALITPTPTPPKHPSVYTMIEGATLTTAGTYIPPVAFLSAATYTTKSVPLVYAPLCHSFAHPRARVRDGNVQGGRRIRSFHPFGIGSSQCVDGP